jgi:hypothetical protein
MPDGIPASSPSADGSLFDGFFPSVVASFADLPAAAMSAVSLALLVTFEEPLPPAALLPVLDDVLVVSSAFAADSVLAVEASTSFPLLDISESSLHAPSASPTSEIHIFKFFIVALYRSGEMRTSLRMQGCTNATILRATRTRAAAMVLSSSS